MRARWVMFFLLAAAGNLMARPGAVNLNQPTGQISDPSPTFVWSEVTDATHYFLWVSSNFNVELAKLVSAADANCVNGSCSLASPKPLGDGRYRWWIQARLPSTLGRWNGPREFRIGDGLTRPGKPSPIAPSGVTEEPKPFFSWEAVDGATRYQLQVHPRFRGVLLREWFQADAICAQGICTVPASLANLDLADGKYYWWVRGANALGSGRRSDNLRFTVQTLPPAPPRPVSIAPHGKIEEQTPAFVWEKQDTATHYRLLVAGRRGQRLTDWYEANQILCPDTTCSTVVDNLALPKGRYTFRVQSKNAGGNSRWSHRRSFRVIDPLPEIPSPLAPRGAADASPIFSWTAVDGATVYVLRVKGPSGQLHRARFAAADVCQADTCSTQISGLTLADGTYHWEIRSRVNRTASPWSQPVEFVVGGNGGGVPDAATGLAPTGEVKQPSPEFVWTHVPGATQYTLIVQDASGAVVFETVYSTTDASCANDCRVTPASMLADGNYGFIVVSENLAGKGPASVLTEFRVASVSNQPPVAAVPKAPKDVIAQASPAFVWMSAPTATMYSLVVVSAGGNIVHEKNYTAAEAACASECTVTPVLVLVDGEYKFHVVSENAAGKGPASSELAFEVDTSQNTPPVATTGTAPMGDITLASPTFVWSSVSAARIYTLIVVDSQMMVKHEQAYSSSDANCTATECSVTPALQLADGAYGFTVTTENAAGKGPASARVDFNVDTSQNTPPGATVGTAPMGDTTLASPTFTWNTVAEARIYNLLVLDDQAGVRHQQAYSTADAACVPAGQCSVTPTLQLADGDYSFTVTTENAAGKGPASAPVDFTIDTSQNTPPGPVTAVSPLGPTATRTPLFSWNELTAARSYALLVLDSASAVRLQQSYTSLEASCGGGLCSITPALDLEDGDYTYNIQASNAAGAGPDSGPFAFSVSLSTSSTVTVTSHNDGDSVAANAFLISGTVEAGTTGLMVTLTVGAMTVYDQSPVQISSNNGWAFFVPASQLQQLSGSAVVSFTATDGSGATSTRSLSLTLGAVDVKSSMLLERAAYGATPQMLDELRTGGASALQNRLLNPVPDGNFDGFVQTLPTASEENLRQYALMHALFNPNQLQEVMTQFWDNHFSTDHDKHDVTQWELDENNAFRRDALGRFRDLLETSAKSPAMLVYLDQTDSSKNDPNENYARELLELHTLSVNGPYNQDDVEELARILTGWKEQNGQFIFDASDHDEGEKNFMNIVFPAGRRQIEGDEVLDMLAAHPATASFLCTKLAQVFVSEQPSAALVSDCATTFKAGHDGGNPNQIRDVLAVLFDSQDFTDPVNYRAKVKTPLEFLASAIRNLDATVVDNRDAEGELRTLGMNLFNNSTPDGFSETGDDWIDTSLMLDRFNFVNEIARENPNREIWVDLRQYFTDRGYETAEGIIGYLAIIALQSEISDVELGLATNILTLGGTQAFDMSASGAEDRLQRLVGTVFSFPEYQHQ